ncbi:hypothetical protein ACSFBX_21770 [Variovorax sp. RB2P76]
MNQHIRVASIEQSSHLPVGADVTSRASTSALSGFASNKSVFELQLHQFF